MLFTLLSLYTQFNTVQEKISNITEIQKSEINDNPIKQSKINKTKPQNFDTIMQEEINKLKQKEQ